MYTWKGANSPLGVIGPRGWLVGLDVVSTLGGATSSDVFVTLRNDGPSMDKRDKLWSMIVHGDGSKHVRIEEDVSSEDFRTLKPP